MHIILLEPGRTGFHAAADDDAGISLLDSERATLERVLVGEGGEFLRIGEGVLESGNIAEKRPSSGMDGTERFHDEGNQDFAGM